MNADGHRIDEAWHRPRVGGVGDSGPAADHLRISIPHAGGGFGRGDLSLRARPFPLQKVTRRSGVGSPTSTQPDSRESRRCLSSPENPVGTVDGGSPGCRQVGLDLPPK
jgi:hypothetical protein